MRCSGSYALPSGRNSNGACGCQCSACAGLRSISPAALFCYQPNLQMEGRLHTSKAHFVFWIKYTRYHVHFKFKDLFQKLNSNESDFPVLILHKSPVKPKRTRKDMPLVGCSGRKNNSPYHVLTCLWVCHYESLAVCHMLYLPFCCVWSLILRDKQKQRWKSSLE